MIFHFLPGLGLAVIINERLFYANSIIASLHLNLNDFSSYRDLCRRGCCLKSRFLFIVQ